MSRFGPRVLDAPPAEWAALLDSDPRAAPAHRPGVWRSLADALPGMRLRFIAIEDDAGLKGGAPVMIERRGGLHWIRALPFLLPGAPLARPGEHAAVDLAVGEALAAMQRELGAVGGEWIANPAAGAPIEARAVEQPDGETRMLESALLDLDGGLDAAWRRMDRKTRQAALKARERGLRFAEEPGSLTEAYTLYLRQSRAWRAHRALPLELSRRLLAAGAGEEAPVARLFAVRDVRGLLSATLALDHPREILLWWSGTHTDARGGQAFTLLLAGVAEWAAAHGRARLNLGGSAGLGPLASYKASLGARIVRYPVRWLDARHASPAGRLVAAAQAVLRRGRPRGEAA